LARIIATSSLEASFALVKTIICRVRNECGRSRI
jgi:hypothetical protein